jgi:hypothetical protein
LGIDEKFNAVVSIEHDSRIFVKVVRQ